MSWNQTMARVTFCWTEDKWKKPLNAKSCGRPPVTEGRLTDLRRLWRKPTAPGEQIPHEQRIAIKKRASSLKFGRLLPLLYCANYRAKEFFKFLSLSGKCSKGPRRTHFYDCEWFLSRLELTHISRNAIKGQALWVSILKSWIGLDQKLHQLCSSLCEIG